MVCISNIHAQNFSLPENPKTLKYLDTSVNHFQSHQSSNIGGILEIYDSRFSQNTNILHLGDEQVAEIAPAFHGSIMGSAQTPGIFFPGCLIHDVVKSEISTQSIGSWIYASPSENDRVIPAGITGYAAETQDENSKLTIIIPTKYQRSCDRFYLFCDRSETSFDILVSTNGGKRADGSVAMQTRKDFIASSVYRNTPWLEVSIPLGTKEIQIQLRKSNSNQTQFLLWGMSLQNSSTSNIHSVGMRGCGFGDLNRLEKFQEQLSILNPAIVLLDFASIDNYRNNGQFGIDIQPLKRCISKVKSAVPNAKIIICIPQDCVRGGRTLPSFELFENAIINYCKTDKITFYNYYRVAGGKYSGQYWLDYNLFMPDGLHLDDRGYQLKSELYASAFIKTSYRYNKGYRQWIINPDSSHMLAFRTRDTLNKNIIVTEVWRYHIVKRGETAYRIAKKYGIGAAQLKDWNQMHSYNLSVGRRLKVGKLAIASKTDPIQNTESKEINESADLENSTPERQETPVTPKPVIPNSVSPNHIAPIPVEPNPVWPTEKTILYHKVKPKETLYSISKQYGLTVIELKRLNGLMGNNIAVNKLLRVRSSRH